MPFSHPERMLKIRAKEDSKLHVFLPGLMPVMGKQHCVPRVEILIRRRGLEALLPGILWIRQLRSPKWKTFPVDSSFSLKIISLAKKTWQSENKEGSGKVMLYTRAPLEMEVCVTQPRMHTCKARFPEDGELSDGKLYEWGHEKYTSSTILNTFSFF